MCRTILFVFVWGRKDAFPGADGSTITQTNPNASTIPIYNASGNPLSDGSTGIKLVDITTPGILSGNTSQIFAIKNPLSFIFNTTTPNDWYTNNTIYQKDDLWSNGMEKSTYDPCPEGWRMPQGETWKDFSFPTAVYYTNGSTQVPVPRSNDITCGLNYNNLTWFPAAGCRYFMVGFLYYVGDYGDSWSATIQTQSCNFGFNSSGIYHMSINPRAYGFAVRCVQE